MEINLNGNSRLALVCCLVKRCRAALSGTLVGAMVFGLTSVAPTVWSDVVQAQELRVAVASHRKRLDPQAETSNAVAQFLYNSFDTLIDRDINSSVPKFIPGLATSWKMVKPTVMELKLRPNVKMHDGTIMDADDVAFSLNRVFKKTRANFHGAWGRFFYNFTGVEVVDSSTVRIHTKRPDPLMETLLSARNAAITSKEYVEKVGFKKAQLLPVGSGPYKMVKFRPNRELVVERFDGFWGKKPPFERIIYKRIPEVTSRITALVNKEVDFITNVPPDKDAVIEGQKHVKLVGLLWPMFHVWVINMNHSVLKDKRVRQAMKLALDREKLVKGLWQGRAVAATAHQFPNYGEPLYMPDLKLIRYDPEKAKKLVKESSYDGTPIVVQFRQGYYLYAPFVAQAMKDMWEKVGLKVKLKMVDTHTSKGPLKGYGKIMVRPWSNPMYYPDPMGAFDTHWSKNSWTYKRGLWTPAHAKWDEYYATARFSRDVEERKVAYTKLLKIAEDEAGYILLYQPYESFAMRKDIEWKVPVGLRPYTLSFRAGQVKIGSK